MSLPDPAARARIGLLLALITIGLGWSATSLRVDHGAESMLPVEGDDLRQLGEFNDTFGSDEVIVLAFHGDGLFSRAGLEFLDALTRRAAGLPHVRAVLGPTTARDVDGDELGPFAVVPYEAVRSGETEPAELGRILGAHPWFGDLLVDGSPSPRTAAVLVEVERVDGDPAYRGRLVERIRAMAADAPGGLRSYVAGMTVEKADLAASVLRDQRAFVPVIVLLLAGTTFVLYRWSAGVVVPLGVVGVSLIWTLGAYALTGQALNPVTSLVTPVVLIVSVAGALHLTNHFVAARGDGLGVEQAVARALARARTPCLGAALTTAFGLLSLWMLPIPAVRSFGLFSAVGVLFAYVLTMSMAPLLLLRLPAPPGRVTASAGGGSLERALGAAAAIPVRHPLGAALVWTVLLALSIAGAARVRVETDVVRSLRGAGPLHEATMFIDRNLTGVNSLEILISGAGADDLPALRRVSDLTEELRGLPGIRKVTGLPDLYARVNRAFHGGDDSFARLPGGEDAEEELADARWLLQEQAPAELSRFVSEAGTLRLAARVTALDSASSQRLFRRIREAAEGHGLDVTLTGNFVVFSNMSTSLVRNQVKGVALAIALILAALTVQFRSLRLGLLGLVPTAAPILMVYGLMGWSGIALSVPTAMIACVALGMTVDNTIHLMAGLRDGSEGLVPALQRAWSTSGRAILFATVALSLGFCVGAFSSFTPTVHFAVLTGTTLLFGLLAVLLLLPLMLVLFRPRERRQPRLVRPALGALVLALAPAGAPRAAGEAIVLKDQHGVEDAVEWHRGETVVLLYGQASGLRRMKGWEEKLTESDEAGFRILRALDAREALGKKTEEEVNARLRRSVPAEIALLVDWNGDLARAYGIPASRVSVVVIGPDGTSCDALSENVTPAGVEEIRRRIAHLETDGHCP